MTLLEYTLEAPSESLMRAASLLTAYKNAVGDARKGAAARKAKKLERHNGVACQIEHRIGSDGNRVMRFIGNIADLIDRQHGR